MAHVAEQILVWEIDYLPSLEALQTSPLPSPLPTPEQLVETLYLSTRSFATPPDDTPANQFYDGRIIDPGSISHEIFQGTATTGRGTSNYGFVEIANTDGALDFLYDAGWGWPAYLRILQPGSHRIDTATTLTQVTVIGIESDDAFRTIRFRIRDPMSVFDNPLLVERYAGTGNEEGDSALAGRLKPLVLGKVWEVPAILINDGLLIYQVSNGPLVFDAVRDGGLSLTNAGDVADYAALAAIPSVTAGTYRTAAAEGMFRLGAVPAFALTVRCFGSAVTGEYSAARQIYEILTWWTDIDIHAIDESSIEAFHSWNNADVGVYVDDERSVMDVISYLADAVGGALIYSFRQGMGQYRLVFIFEPTGVAFSPPALASPDYYPEPPTYTLDDIIQSGFIVSLGVGPVSEGNGRPVWQVTLKYARNWSVLNISQLAGAVVGNEIVNFFTTEWSEASVRSLEGLFFVINLLPAGAVLTFDTALDNFNGASNEASRRLGLYDRRRDRLTVPLSFANDPEMGDVRLGDQVLIQMDRFGYDQFSPSGKPFIVIGRKDDYKARVRILTLWG